MNQRVNVRVEDGFGRQFDLTDDVESLRWSNINPGGFESASFNVPASKVPPGGSTLVISDSLGTIWEGRVEEGSLDVNERGDRRSVTAYGFGIKLKKTTFREIYVSADLGRYGGAGVARKVFLETIGYAALDPSTVGDDLTGQPALLSEVQGAWGNGGQPHCSGYLDTGGIPLGSIYYAWKINGNINSADAQWVWEARLCDDMANTTVNSTGTLRAAGPGTGTLTASGAAKYVVEMVLYYGANPAGTDGNSYALFWTCLAIYGTHGLTKRGSESATLPKGFYGGDVIANMVAKVAGIGVGRIDAPTYVIRDLAFFDRVDVESGVVEVNKLFGYDWGVWDSGSLTDTTPKFWWTAKQTAAKWNLKKSQCRIDLASSLSSMADTVYVPYKNVTGDEKELTATSSVRALVAAGMTGQTLSIGDGSLVTVENAQQFADTFFSLQGQDPPLHGSIEITGDVAMAEGGSRPAYHMRADGSLMRIEDLLPITEVYVLDDLRQTLLPIKRVECDASGDKIVTSVEVDQSNDSMTILQAQLADRTKLMGAA